MREFNTQNQRTKWDSDILGYIAAIYKEAGKQEQYLKQRPEELEKLVEIAKVQSTGASNAIEGIVTTNTRIKQLVEKKRHQETVTNRKLLDTVMYLMSFTKALMPFRFPETIYCAAQNHVQPHEQLAGRTKMFKTTSVLLIRWTYRNSVYSTYSIWNTGSAWQNLWRI